jgi:hypothetical protein
MACVWGALPVAAFAGEPLDTASETQQGATCNTTWSSCGYPDKTNTGIPSGLFLRPSDGEVRIVTDNAVVEGLEIIGSIFVEATNVTIRNSRIVPEAGAAAISITPTSTGFSLIDSEIIGDGKTQNGASGFGTFLRNNIHGFENGLNLSGPSLVTDNYIHRMAGSPEAHFDGIEINSGSGIIIRHNTVINDQGQTSAVMLDNWAGGLSDIVVDDNLLIGGGYTLYLDGRFGGGAVDEPSIQITNNRIGKGSWGDFALYDSKPTMFGNVALDPQSSPAPSEAP